MTIYDSPPESLRHRVDEDRRRLLLLLACRCAVSELLEPVTPAAAAAAVEQLAGPGEAPLALLGRLAELVASPLPVGVEGLGRLAAEMDVRLTALVPPAPASASVDGITVDGITALRPPGDAQPSHVRVVNPPAGREASS